MDSTHTSTPDEAVVFDDIITDPEEIRNQLELLLLEEERIELEADGEVRLYFSYLKDSPPESAASGDPKSSDSTSAPFSYLRKREYLLIDPVVPRLGNAKILKSQQLLIRFFNGVHQVTAEITFAGVKEGNDGTKHIMLSYPQQLGVIRRRRHHRTKLSPNTRTFLSVQIGEHPPWVSKFVDISLGGVSFCSPQPESLPINESIHLILHDGEGSELAVDAFVRQHLPPGAGKGVCSNTNGPCGVQFDILNVAMQDRLAYFSNQAQREYLAWLRQKRERLGVGTRLLHLESHQPEDAHGGSPPRQEEPQPAPLEPEPAPPKKTEPIASETKEGPSTEAPRKLRPQEPEAAKGTKAVSGLFGAFSWGLGKKKPEKPEHLPTLPRRQKEVELDKLMQIKNKKGN